MGVSKRTFNIIPAWTRTVADLIAEPATVTVCCNGHCKPRSVDLARVLKAEGPFFSFWDRHPPCATPGCGRDVFFYAQRVEANVWMTHMQNGPPAEVDALHAFWRAWKALPHALRPRPPVTPA